MEVGEFNSGIGWTVETVIAEFCDIGIVGSYVFSSVVDVFRL